MPFKQLPEEHDDSWAMWLFHKVFGHGSSDNPGGSGRMETGDWILVLGSVVAPIRELLSTSDDLTTTLRLMPVMFVLGALIVRASKKPGLPPEEPDEVEAATRR